MAPPTPKPKINPDKAAKGIGGKLGKKVGPLPLWAWLGIGGAAVLGLYILSKRDQTEGMYGGPEVVSGSISPQDMASAGAPLENAAPGGQMSQEALDSYVSDRLQGALGGVFDYQNELRGQNKDIEDALERAGWSFEDGQITPPGMGQGVFNESWPAGVSEVINGNGGVQKSPQSLAQLANSMGAVAWGGQVFTTKRALGGFLQGRGQSYAKWAKQHPTAAQQLSGPAPRPKPKPKPAPRPKIKPRAPTQRNRPKPKPKPKPAPRRMAAPPPKRRPAAVRIPARRGI